MSQLLADLNFVPETFADYVHRGILKRSNFVQSGAVVADSTIVPAQGSTVTLPYWGGLSGDAEVLSDSAPLSRNNVANFAEVAPILERGKMFSYNDLVANFTGSDPMGAVGDKVAAYWTQQLDATTVAALVGAMTGANNAGDIVTDAATADIDVNAIIDARASFGEYLTDGMAIVLNPVAVAKLTKDDVVDAQYVGTQNTVVKSVLEMPVILSNTIGAGQAMIVRPGACRYADGSNPAHVLEADRDIAAGANDVATRQRWAVAVAGASFTGNPAASTASNAELANALNWAAIESPLRLGARLITYTPA